VHGAICAAASRHLPASDANTIRMHCPIDFSRITRVETTGCGVFIGAGIVEIPAVSQKLWDDARYIVDNLRMARSPAAGGRNVAMDRGRDAADHSQRQRGGIFCFPATKLRSHFESRRPAACR